MSLAAIHILKNELALTDAEYREVLRHAAGVASAKLLDEDGDRAVMRALYAIRDQRRAVEKERPKSPAERKVWGLWYELRGYLPEAKRNAVYLAGFAEHFGQVKRSGGNELRALRSPPDATIHRSAQAAPRCRTRAPRRRGPILIYCSGSLLV